MRDDAGEAGWVQVEESFMLTLDFIVIQSVTILKAYMGQENLKVTQTAQWG